MSRGFRVHARAIVVGMAVLALLAAGLLPGNSGVSAASPVAKQTCHTVTKKVHGKKKKVKVCKAAPKPTAMAVPGDEAAHLADEVSKASTPAARQTALMDVMKAL